MFPHPVERMLKERKLVGAAGEAIKLTRSRFTAGLLPRREGRELVEQTIDQRGLDCEATNSSRPFDCSAALIARHSRREELRGVHALGETLDQGAGAQIFRAHGHHDIDRDLSFRLAAFQQKRNESFSLLPPGIAL